MVFILMSLMACLLVAFDGRSRRDGVVVGHVARLPRVIGTVLVGVAIIASAGHSKAPASLQSIIGSLTGNDLAAVIGLGGLLIAAGVFIELGALIQRQLFVLERRKTMSVPTFSKADHGSNLARKHHVLSLAWWSILAVSFMATAVGHWRFYADADPRQSGWMAAGASSDLMTQPSCNGALLVKNYNEQAASYRCASAIGWVMAEWTDQPLLPWPGYNDGASQELSAGIRRSIGSPAPDAAQATEPPPHRGPQGEGKRPFTPIPLPPGKQPGGSNAKEPEMI